MIKADYCKSSYRNTLPGYLENQVSKLTPFYHTDLKDSLEKIVIKDEPVKEEGMLERVFSDKGKNLKATIKALFKEIQLRERLDTFLIYKIDEDICDKKSRLAHLNGLRTHYHLELHQNISKSKKELEGDLLELGKEKRKEYLECWRDLMFMKKYLMTSLKDYWDMAKKRNMLSLDISNITNDENNKGYRGSMQEA